MKRVTCFGVIAAAGLVVLPMAALASHGKAGLWEITTTIDMAGVQMPDISKLPPEAQAQLRKMGVQMNGNSITTQHCMTAAEVSTDRPTVTMQHMKDCSMEHITTGGGTMSADLVCSTGEMTGSGHFSVSYSGDTQYSGSMTMSGTAEGHPVHSTYTFQGHWISADCGGVTH